ncbi:hypothetical protein [Clostridium peptidivorans]|uniref:hypothetical protein n=1 Tax=Clostridium peptidivorans TaxID=100174 RepID=UPI000BE43332|nr:hypothetical protein [Clostridium peptidivorans]
MVKISYEKEKFITEELEFCIEDTKNIFLEGRTESNNRLCYLGIWTNKKGLKEVTLSDNNIYFDYSLTCSVSTEITIKNFLRKHTAIKAISKDMFFSKLDDIKTILES